MSNILLIKMDQMSVFNVKVVARSDEHTKNSDLIQYQSAEPSLAYMGP